MHDDRSTVTRDDADPAGTTDSATPAASDAAGPDQAKAVGVADPAGVADRADAIDEAGIVEEVRRQVVLEKEVLADHVARGPLHVGSADGDPAAGIDPAPIAGDPTPGSVPPASADVSARDVDAPSTDMGRPASRAMASTEGRLERALRTVVLALLGLYAVWAPMVHLGWAQAQILYGAALGFGVIALSRGSWPRAALPPLILYLAHWAVLWATHDHWAAWDTTHTRAVQETYALRACALNSVGAAALAGARRFGVRSVRRLWALIGGTLLVMATGEVLTRTHFSPGGPYAPPAFSPAGPFGNPNNLACVLVVVLGLVLGRMSERLTILRRVFLALVATLTLTLVVLTLSRAAVAATAVVSLSAAVLAASRSPRGRRLLRPRRLRTRARVALVAAMATPALVAAAALWRIVATTGDEQARSDGLRATLVRLALDHWHHEPWLGIGGGRFEMLLRDEHPEVGHVLPVHNTFVELLTEYGLVGAAALFALLTLAAVTVVRPIRAPLTDGRPRTLDDAGVRHLLAVLLVGIGLAGTVTSSALNWQVWWLMIATLTVLTGHLWARRTTGRSETVDASV
ncbi:O-antigen ligase family protein [Mobilicoccus pelagius]|uniref:O-antigen ligase-related domain-containing protein n=1 Tax=Mobilicoccus pelagius NBRC 104925 TaxID=1089455 RepID=H5UMZ5_9MICO|nr:O-antigen ligase family protein [Mobilicoccus pelagius]GAB47103.1 hypothetical protein MOPEL_003_01280 [Mobilicoccus pelagius NBRC 104925]